MTYNIMKYPKTTASTPKVGFVKEVNSASLDLGFQTKFVGPESQARSAVELELSGEFDVSTVSVS